MITKPVHKYLIKDKRTTSKTDGCQQKSLRGLHSIATPPSTVGPENKQDEFKRISVNQLYMLKCSTYGCKYSSKHKKNLNISLHCFPKDEKIKKRWENAACGVSIYKKIQDYDMEHF